MSETLTNQEVLLLLKSFRQSLSIFREVERLPTKKEQQLWTERGINEWLVKDMMLEEIREMLDGDIDSSKERQIFTEEEENEKRSLSSLALNSTQLRFLQILYRDTIKSSLGKASCSLWRTFWNVLLISIVLLSETIKKKT